MAASAECPQHPADDEESYGKVPPVLPGGEVIHAVQVKEINIVTMGEKEYAEEVFSTYETGQVLDTGFDVVRVELYEGKKVRVLLADGKNEDGSWAGTAWCYPWHQVLYWQEA